MSKKRILVIDDEEDFCFFIKQNLEKNGGFAVTYTTDPDKGIRIAQKELPDLILLDIIMPKKTGIKVLEVLKQDKKTMLIPIIMLTAVEDNQTKLKASHYYSEDYIVKPVTYALLKAKIDEVLSRCR